MSTKCKAYNGFYDDAFELYPNHTIYGPYRRKSDNRRIVILYDGIKRSARQYAKIKLEIKIGRKLKSHEEVDHADGDKTNDKFDNLQVLSKKKNRQKAYKEGNVKKFPVKFGEDCGASVLLEKDVFRIRELYSKRKSKYDRKYSERNLAKMFNVCRDTIHSIVNRKTWKHI